MKTKWNVYLGALTDSTLPPAVATRLFGSERRTTSRGKIATTTAYLWQVVILKMSSSSSGTRTRTYCTRQATTILLNAGDLRTLSMTSFAHILLKDMNQLYGSLISTERADIWSAAAKIRTGWYGIYKSRHLKIRGWYLDFIHEQYIHAHGQKLKLILLERSLST